MSIERFRQLARLWRSNTAPIRAVLLVLLIAGVAGPITARADTSLGAGDPEFVPAAVSEPARLLRRMPATYSEAARREGISGVVVVRARVGRDGRVRETLIAHSIPALDAFASNAVSRYEFVSARLGDDEVESWVEAPVRFDESCPTGTRGSEPVEPVRYSDAERAFESDIETLRQGEPGWPNDDDVAQRERVMTGSLALDIIPPPGAEAVRAFREGDSLGHSADLALRDRRTRAWIRAAYLAPWWPLPYRRLASVAVAERDYAAAALCVRVILAGRPNDEASAALMRRARQLRLAEGRDARSGKGRKSN